MHLDNRPIELFRFAKLASSVAGEPPSPAPEPRASSSASCGGTAGAPHRLVAFAQSAGAGHSPRALRGAVMPIDERSSPGVLQLAMQGVVSLCSSARVSALLASWSARAVGPECAIGHRLHRAWEASAAAGSATWSPVSSPVSAWPSFWFSISQWTCWPGQTCPCQEKFCVAKASSCCWTITCACGATGCASCRRLAARGSAFHSAASLAPALATAVRARWRNGA
jgi:hypothetical protein